MKKRIRAAAYAAIGLGLAALLTVTSSAIAEDLQRYTVPATGGDVLIDAFHRENEVKKAGDHFTQPGGIYENRYLAVASVKFPGTRGQTIDTGVSIRDNLPTTEEALAGGLSKANGILIQATTRNTQGSGYVVSSSSGVYSSAAASGPVLLPKYGLFYGDGLIGTTHSSFTRATLNEADLAGYTSVPPAYATKGGYWRTEIATVLFNRTGKSFYFDVSFDDLWGQTVSQEGINRNSSILAGETFLIGGVGGDCLGDAVKCQDAWTKDAQYRSAGTGTMNYTRASMFLGEMTAFTIEGWGDRMVFIGIPVSDMYTGQCGFYDTISKKFVTSQTAGVLQCGSPVSYEAHAMLANPSGAASGADVLFTLTKTDDAETCSALMANSATPIGCFYPTQETPTMMMFVIPSRVGLLGDTKPGSDVTIVFTATGTTPKGLATNAKDHYTETVSFVIDYADPPGQLTIRKQAWAGVGQSVSTWADFLNDKGKREIKSGSVATPDDLADVTFSYTVTFVPDIPGDELTYVSITDNLLGPIGKVSRVADNAPGGCFIRMSPGLEGTLPDSTVCS